MIVVAIIGVLAAIALPAYQDYIRKAAYSEVIVQASAVKTAISECMSVHAVITSCDEFSELGITLPLPKTKALDSLEIEGNTAIIKMAPVEGYKGLKNATDTCTLTPTFDAEKKIISKWEFGGACVTNGFVKN